jgi:VWFA-related protein
MTPDVKQVPWLLILALSLAPAMSFGWQAAASAQQPQSEPDVYQSQTVLRATTRLVVVDVVASDSKGQPVEDLAIDDFTVLENGKPQKIIGFSFQRSARPTEAKASSNPNVFSNEPKFKGASALNVILLDSLNAEFNNKAHAREQVIAYLRSDPAIQPTAVYSLEDRLKLLHDFTTDTKLLASILTNFKPTAPTHVVDVYSAASPFGRKGDYMTTPLTMETTVRALDQLARVLGGYPGRKNLIWISEGFPLVIYPEINFDNPNPTPPASHAPDADVVNRALHSETSGGNFDDEVQRVANAMMNAQVAIYPVDSAGVQENNKISVIGTMRTLAERTGGKAYINRNDVDAGVRESMDDGSTYYTLEYYPQDKNWDRTFRVIRITTTRGGATLRYRQGYYALDPEKPAKDSEKSLARSFSDALGLSAPMVASITFEAGVNPPSPSSPQVVVNFAVDPRNLAFERAGNEFHAEVSCAVAAYSEKGSLVKEDVTDLKATVKAENYQKVMDGSFPCKRTLDLKPGSYKLMLGVLDHKSRLMGITQASVVVH